LSVYHGIGKILYHYSSIKPSKNQCLGCRENMYNSSSKECWAFVSARVVDKEAYSSIHSTKPSIFKKTLSCYRGK
jgi:hypothetical protein